MRAFAVTTSLPWLYLRDNCKFFPVNTVPSDFFFSNVLKRQTSLNGFSNQLKKNALITIIPEETATVDRLMKKGFFLDAAETLASLSMHHIESDSGNALIKAENAITDAKKLCATLIQSGKDVDGAKISLAKVLCTSAMLYQERGEFHLAIDACKSAIDTITEVTGNKFHSAHWRFYSDLCLALLSSGFYSEAINVYADIYDQMHPTIKLPHCFYHRQSLWQEKNINLGVITGLCANNEESMAWFNKALSEVKLLKNNFSVVLALYNLSVLHHKLGDNENALQAMQEAKALYCHLNKGIDTSEYPLSVLINNFIHTVQMLQTHARASSSFKIS